MSKITVQVTDTLSVVPDTIVLYLSINYKNKQYNSCFNEGVGYCKSIMDILAKYSNRVEIGNKYVTEDKKRVETKKGDTSSVSYRRVGYTFNTLITVKFSSEFDKLDYLTKELESFNSFLTMSYSYCLDDTETYKDKLLEKLVDLARKKADILAKASGLSISGISEIYYNKPDYGNTMYGMRCADMSNSLQSVVGTEMAKPITLSDSVTVIYKTKG